MQTRTMKQIKSEINTRSMKTNIKMVVVLLGCLAVAGRAALADHALSEVWNESDGLQVKYSTNHDDMLGGKGSELSLSSVQHKQAADTAGKEVDASGANGESAEGSQREQEESSPASIPAAEQQTNESAEQSSRPSEESSSGESSSSSQEEQQQQQNVNDESADSSQRQTTERIPSAPSAGRSKQQRNNFHDIPSTRVPSSRKSSSREPDFPPSFGSALESVGEGESESAKSSTAAASPTSEDEENSFLGAKDIGSSGQTRFRQPGRLFKEAVRSTEAAAEAKADEGQDESDNESSKQTGASSGSGNGDDDEEEAAAPVHSSRRSPKLQPGESARLQQAGARLQQQDMIEQGLRQRQAIQQQASDEMPPEMANAMPASDDESGDGEQQLPMGQQQEAHQMNGFRRGMQLDGGGLPPAPPSEEDQFQQFIPHGFYDQSGHRAMAAGSSAHKERAQPNSAAAAAAAAEEKKSKPTKAPSSTNPSAYKQLAYFKGVQQLDARERRPQIEATSSPDSVRDDFISPGHFPGSMPHLTQAASETQKRQLELADSNKSAADQLKPSAAAVAVAVAESSQPATANQPLMQAASDTSFNKPALVSSSSSTTQAAIQVTPEPEPQPESEQIMAPILYSTTTMAPMPATSSTSPSTSTTTTTTTASPSVESNSTSTSQAPSLKRFKFRKYR